MAGLQVASDLVGHETSEGRLGDNSPNLRLPRCLRSQGIRGRGARLYELFGLFGFARPGCDDRGDLVRVEVDRTFPSVLGREEEVRRRPDVGVLDCLSQRLIYGMYSIVCLFVGAHFVLPQKRRMLRTDRCWWV
jgi:hypothetical protein